MRLDAPVQPAEVLYAKDMSYDELVGLSGRTWLKKLVTDGSEEYAAFAFLHKALPDCDIHWTYELNGKVYDSDVTELTVDTTDGLHEALQCLPDVETVDMTSFEPDTETLDSLIADYPQIQFLFYVHFGHKTVRSDITCFSTLIGLDSDIFTSETISPLFKYCKHLRALDIGHNRLTDLTELGTLTELQVLIIADNKMTDISPIGNLVNLEYLELFLNRKVTDLSALSNLTKLKYLNLGYLTRIKDIDFIEDLPELKMLWTRGSGVPKALMKEYEEKYPDIQFHYTCSNGSSTCHGWRATEENLSIRKAFRNWQKVSEFRSMNDVEYFPDVDLFIPEPSYK